MPTVRFKGLIARIIIALLLLGFVAVLPAVFIGPAPSADVPVLLQNWAFDVRLATGLPARSVLSLLGGSAADKRIYWDSEGEQVQFENGDLKIVGTLYEPAANIPANEEVAHPAILLLHGSTPVGRQLGMYRVMGRELAKHGYVVLSIDQRGYGRSDNPRDTQSAANFDFVADVSRAVDFLLDLNHVRAQEVIAIGHSFGGDVVLSAAAAEPRLQKVVAIGPGRRFTERGGELGAPKLDYFRRREMRYMLLWEPIPTKTFLAYRAVLPIENHIKYFKRAHQPLLLIDGALENEQDRQFLSTIYDSMSEPKTYMTLPNANHYANTANLGPLVVYDQRVIDQLVQEIVIWLEE